VERVGGEEGGGGRLKGGSGGGGQNATHSHKKQCRNGFGSQPVHGMQA
jgi:hypothetical protein